MRKVKIIIYVAFLLLSTLSAVASAQSSPYFSYTYSIDGAGNYTYTFTPNMSQILADYPLDYSHPDASYGPFWSFGDGHYSFEESPVHVYESSGPVEVLLEMTPRYSPTDVPPCFTATSNMLPGIFSNINDDPMLLFSRDPSPDKNSHLVVNYENITGSTIRDAKLRVYFNKEYFNHVKDRLFNSEINNGTTEDTTLLPKYNNYITYKVGDLDAGEQHTLMIQLMTTLEAMGPIGEPLPDLFIKAELFFEKTTKNGTTEEIIQEFEMISHAVGVWDPNDKIALTNDLFYNKMASNEWVEYRVNFQNIGSAPAKNVYIVDTLSGDFDSTTFEITDYYHPKINIWNGFSYTYDSLTRVLVCWFKNINLDGTKQSNVTNPEMTKGYVTFRAKTMDKQRFNPTLYTVMDSCLPYYQLKNKAYIVFDHNDTMGTNVAYTSLYVNDSAACFDTKGGTRNPPEFKLYPNPVVGKKIEIGVTNLSSTFRGFSSGNISYRLYNSVFNQVNCSLSPSYSSTSSGTAMIRLQPSCLSTGIHYLVITYDSEVYRIVMSVR